MKLFYLSYAFSPASTLFVWRLLCVSLVIHLSLHNEQMDQKPEEDEQSVASSSSTSSSESEEDKETEEERRKRLEAIKKAKAEEENKKKMLEAQQKSMSKKVCIWVVDSLIDRVMIMMRCDVYAHDMLILNRLPKSIITGQKEDGGERTR